MSDTGRTRLRGSGINNGGNENHKDILKEVNLNGRSSRPTLMDSLGMVSHDLHRDDDNKERTFVTVEPPTANEKGTYRRVFIITHVCVFLHAVFYWIQNAVLPYLSEQMGADPVTYGYIQTTFEMFQLFGGFIFCSLDHSFGIRVAMVIGFVSAAWTYLTMYLATSVSHLFMSRVTAVFMHPVQGGQMMVTYACDPQERASALAKVGFSYDLGTVLGRLLGGVVAKLFSLKSAALISCVGSMVCVVLSYCYIPRRIKPSKYTAPSSDSVYTVSKVIHIIRSPGVLFLIAIKFGFGIPIGIFLSRINIVAMETFEMPADTNSYMMSYLAVLSMLIQLFAVDFVTKRLSVHIILAGSGLMLAVSFLLFSFVTSPWQMFVVFVPLMTATTFQNIIITAALANSVSSSDTGTMLGLNTALYSLNFIISPTLGAHMSEALGFQSIGYFGCVACGLFTMVLIIKLRWRYNYSIPT